MHQTPSLHHLQLFKNLTFNLLKTNFTLDHTNDNQIQIRKKNKQTKTKRKPHTQKQHQTHPSPYEKTKYPKTKNPPLKAGTDTYLTYKAKNSPFKTLSNDTQVFTPNKQTLERIEVHSKRETGTYPSTRTYFPPQPHKRVIEKLTPTSTRKTNYPISKVFCNSHQFRRSFTMLGRFWPFAWSVFFKKLAPLL